MKKNNMENTEHMIAAMTNALYLEPTFAANYGERLPNITHVSSPKVMNNV